jgi:hypothetical protein
VAIDCDGFLDAIGNIVPPKTAKCRADSIAITDVIPPRMAKCYADLIAVTDTRRGSDLMRGP